MIPWSLTALTVNNVLPIAVMVMFVIGYDSDGGCNFGGDDDTDNFLPNAISKVVVVIFIALKF